MLSDHNFFFSERQFRSKTKKKEIKKEGIRNSSTWKYFVNIEFTHYSELISIHCHKISSAMFVCNRSRHVHHSGEVVSFGKGSNIFLSCNSKTRAYYILTRPIEYLERVHTVLFFFFFFVFREETSICLRYKSTGVIPSHDITVLQCLYFKTTYIL